MNQANLKHLDMNFAMNRHLISVLLIILGLTACDTSIRVRRLYPLKTYRNKIEGAWLGQMIGLSFGEHFNLRWQNRMVPFTIDDFLKLKPEAITEMNRALKRSGARNWTKIQHQFIDDRENWISYSPQQLNDKEDLFFEILYLHTLNRLPLHAIESRDFAEDWMEYLNQEKIWHASRTAHANFGQGIWPPESGEPENNAHWEDVDFQKSSELFGLMCPGLPDMSRAWSEKVGSLMCAGDGIRGGTFVAGMISSAFFEENVDSVVARGLRSIPDTSEYAENIREVIRLKNNGKNWHETWQVITEKWGMNDNCPQGERLPLNLSALLNGAYVTIGLLYGKKNFWETLEIVTRCGQNSEGNAATAAAVLGCILGAKEIPEKCTDAFTETIKNNMIREIYPVTLTLEYLVNQTAATGLKFIEHAGGKRLKKFDNEYIIIPFQSL